MRKTFSSFGLLLITVVACWFAGLAFFVRDAALMQPPQTRQNLDAIVVLTGGSNRLDTGFALLENGLGKKLFISGVYRGNEIKTLLKRWREEPQKNLDCCVVLGFEADSTLGNATETATWLRKEGFKSAYLVTSNYHMKRAELAFARVMPDITITPFPVVPEKFDLDGWWRETSTRNLVLREYIKYSATRLLHLVRL